MFLLQSDIFFWDLMILLLMAVLLSLGIGCLVLRKQKGNVALGVLGVLGVLGFVTVAYSAFIEPQIITVTKTTMEHPMGHSMKIAVVSDFHVGPYKKAKFVQKAVERINGTLPDLVLLPGDFVFTMNADIEDLDPLKNLNAPMGVFAVLGNHDVGEYQSLSGVRFSGESKGEAIAKKLEELGITVLRNENKQLSTPEGTVAVAGVDDIWTGHHDLPLALSGIPKAAFTILVSHNPSIVDAPRSLDAHLIATGHTHGGQMRMPGLGPISSLPTSLGKSYDQGLFSMDNDTTLAITRGIGESSPRTRLFAWPEILLIQVENTR